MKNQSNKNSTTSIPNEKYSQRECNFIDTFGEAQWQLEALQDRLRLEHAEALIDDANENSLQLAFDKMYEKFKELKPMVKKVECDDGDLFDLVDNDISNFVCNQQIAAMNASNKEERLQQKLNDIDMIMMSMGDLEVADEDDSVDISVETEQEVETETDNKTQLN